jgi:hypothetical protein
MTFWVGLQAAVIALIVSWAQTPEMQQSGGDNPQAIAVFAVVMAMAVTAAVMIGRDSILFVWRRLTSRRSLRETHQANDGARRIEAGTGLRQPRELPPGGRVRKQIR